MTTSTRDLTGGLTELAAGARMPWHLRALAVVLALAVSVSALLDFAGVDAAEAAYKDSAEVLNLAGRQRMLSQRLAQLGVRLAAGGDRTLLTPELSRAAEQLQRGQAQLLQLPSFGAVAAHAPDVEPLLRVARALQASDKAGAAAAAERLVAEGEAFLPRMEATLEQVQANIEAAGHASEITHAKGMTALALFVSALALGGGEWLARRMARQHQRLRQQADELERLALVAERTHNAVAIADAEGRMVWANQGFTRITGYPLSEVLGKRPGTLLQFEGTDPATAQQIRVALAAHEPVQVQILNRGKHGRVYWVHLDIQPLPGSDGRPRGFVAVETDITEQVQERERLASVLRALPVGVVQQGGDGRVTDANPEACRILGISQEQARLGVAVDQQRPVVSEDGAHFPAEQQPAAQALRTGVPVRGVMMGLSLPDGEQRWLRVNAEPVLGADGVVSSVVSSFADVTEVTAQRRLLSLTVEAAGLGTWDWQMRANRVHFNEQWWRMLGYPPGAMPESFATWESLVHAEDLPAALHALERHVREPGQPYRCEFRMRRAGGDWAWIMAAGAVTERDSQGTPWRMAGIHMDITQRKVMERRLEDAALTDALTGLPNRSALLARLVQCAARTARDPGYTYALLFMDFDRFKQVNDTLGHEAGDELLRQIAQRLRTTLRPGDDLARLDSGAHTAARLGGDEFVALLEPLLRTEDACTVAQRLLDALAAPYTVCDQQVYSTASIGIVTSERADRDPEALLRDADIAMYEAKRRGRARYVVFSPDMHQRVRQAMSLESDLRRALVTPGELFVAYQPIVDLGSGAVVGVEALARWNHPTRGLVPPVEFIPLAEENGLIGELGELVLMRACQDAADWRAELGPRAPRTVSVNLSRAQIRKGGVLAAVQVALARSGLPVSALRLEVTESLAMQDEAMVAKLHKLRALGVSLALDDFGTGYSSLASLDQLPLDVVKIDRSFVQRVTDSRYQQALVQATLQVAAALGLEVVAEGVETEAQAQALRQAGCRLAQGWLFGHPEPAAALAQRLRAETGPPPA